MQQCQVHRGSFRSDGTGCSRWQKCKYHTKSSSEQSSESTDLCTDTMQATLSADVEIQIKPATSERRSSLLLPLETIITLKCVYLQSGIYVFTV